MKAKLLVLGILLALMGCEKETIEPLPPYVDVIGAWDLYHTVNGVSTNKFLINDCTYTFRINIFKDNFGEYIVTRNEIYYGRNLFYIDVQKDSIHFAYMLGEQPWVMLPEQGWSMYRRFDDVLLIGYQSWRSSD